MSYDDSVPRASQIAPLPEARVSIPQTWPPAPQPTTSRAQSESPSIWHGYDAFHIHPRHNYDTRPYLYDANHLTFAQRTHPPATDRTPSTSPTTHPSTSTTSSTVCAFALRLSQSHFTGKERDSESGNDYFGARYYGSSMGRFMSPDPSGLLAQHPEDPQSWNLYAYARNNPLINIDPTGLDCVYTSGSSSSVDHNSSSSECGGSEGTWVSGYVDEDWVHFNKTNGMFEAASEDGSNVNFAQFGEGAQTTDSGSCTSGCGGYGFASADAGWLTGQLVGNSKPRDGSDPLDGLLTFMTGRAQAVSDFWKAVAGPLNGRDNWAGPGGMGPPTGTGDWKAAVHDYNFSQNGPAPGQGITIGMYFNPHLSLATSKALIQSNEQLMKTGGFQGAKEKMVFGPVNAFQWYANSWK